MSRPIGALLALALALSARHGGTYAASAAPRLDIMPFKEVTAGMKGTGRTVFKGTAIEEFSVEILATMENIQPKKNLILARLEGGPLRETGILEGMSGSPVYLDGRLAGAVSYSWGFSKEPICGITPIEEMLEVLDRGTELPEGTARSGALWPARPVDPAPVDLLAWPDRMVEFLRSRTERLTPAIGRPVASGIPGSAGSLTPLRPTLVLSGFAPEVARDWFGLFESMSFRPVIGGAASGAALAAAQDSGLTAGSAFGVNLVRGDLDITAIGTVTWTDGERMLGLGHPLLGLGSIALPMRKAYVHGAFPSLLSSFKLAVPLEEVGAITQDRFPGVAGRRGAAVKMVPVRVELRRADGTSRSFKLDIVPDPLLTPGLLNASLLSLLSAEEKDVGEMTLRLREGSRIQISKDLDVKLDNLFSGDLSSLYAAGTVAYMTYLLLNNEDRPSPIEGINLLLDLQDTRRIARIERIWLDRYTATPGETLTLRVDLRPFREAPSTVEVPLKIPEEAPEGKTLLQVGDSLTLSRMESVAGGSPLFVPRSLEHLVWLLNNIRSNQKIYATLIRPDTGAFISGERLPNLPPSVASVLLRPGLHQDTSARVRFRALLEANASTANVVRGYQRAVIEIKR